MCGCIVDLDNGKIFSDLFVHKEDNLPRLQRWVGRDAK
jgi:hypothetical protein